MLLGRLGNRGLRVVVGALVLALLRLGDCSLGQWSRSDQSLLHLFTILRQPFDLGFQFNLPRCDLLQQLGGCVVAQRREFSILIASRSIIVASDFAVMVSTFSYLGTGKIRAPQEAHKPYPRRSVNHRPVPQFHVHIAHSLTRLRNRAPIATTAARGTGLTLSRRREGWA
jgi:hypothetical protein